MTKGKLFGGKQINRRLASVEPIGISFLTNQAQSGNGIFWQFRGESAKKKHRTTEAALKSFHNDIRSECDIKDVTDGFLASSAISM